MSSGPSSFNSNPSTMILSNSQKTIFTMIPKVSLFYLIFPCPSYFVLLIDDDVSCEAESTSLEQKKRSNYGLELALADKVIMEGKIDEGSEPQSPRTVIVKQYSSRKNKRKDRVDLVLERAQACLKKIRHLKTSLLSPS